MGQVVTQTAGELFAGRTFDSPAGIVIPIGDIVAGGRLGVMQALKTQLDEAETTVVAIDETIAALQAKLDDRELELARALARRDALQTAIDSARRAFGEEVSE